MLTIRREVYPQVSFDTLVVTTAYPNASAETIENLITSPLELKLKGITGIDEMKSHTTHGMSTITIKLDTNQTTVDTAETDAQSVINSFTKLPENALEPNLRVVDTKNAPLIEVTISGQASKRDLYLQGKKIERILGNINGVSNVVTTGLPEQEFQIKCDHKKLAKLKVSFSEVIQALRQAPINAPAGILNAENQQISIKTISEIKSTSQIENTIIRSNLGQVLKIKDVAKADLSFKKVDTQYLINGEPAVVFKLSRRTSEDSIRLAKAIKQKTRQLKDSLPPNLKIMTINDSSELVKQRIGVLSNNLFIGLAIVVVILTIFLPLRVALVAAIGIPFSFLSALLIFDLGDISLNLISIMGLIIVVGMLVDDAIVVTENAQAKMDQGMAPQAAAIAGTQEIWKPVTASVLTTIAAFLPLMFVPGIMGKFTRNMPIGVIIALIASLVECFFFLPGHIAAWVRHKDAGSRKTISNFWQSKIIPLYRQSLSFVLRWRYMFLACVASAVLASIIFAVKVIPFILFPGSPGDSY